MEPCAWVLGTQSRVSAHMSLLDPADAGTVAADTSTDTPPGPLHPLWPTQVPLYAFAL